MSEQLYKQQEELVKLIKQNTVQDGVLETIIPSLFFIRESNVTEPIHGVYKPSFCMIVQGEKEVFLSEESFKYSPDNYLVASTDLPVTGQVIRASLDAPYLALKLEFTPSQILDVLKESDLQDGPKKNTTRAMFVSKMESSLLDAVVRLTGLLNNPKDIPVLAPLYKKEILYRVLQGPHGDTLKQIAMEGSNSNRIRDVIEHIKSNYIHSLRIEELSEIANMSVATLHRHFKDTTGMSPIQFQKRLRLQESRRLLLAESTDAADVAFRVGYESPSQFSREYSRMFGFPPREDINRLRKRSDQKIKA